MAELANYMPSLSIPTDELQRWGSLWLGNLNPETGQSKSSGCFDRHQSVNFASFIDVEFAKSLAVMLGGIPIKRANGVALNPLIPDCVEVGSVRIIGGIRPQNFDVAYRPDGPPLSSTAKPSMTSKVWVKTGRI